MLALDRLTGLPGWIAHRLFANYWMLAVCATLAAIPFTMAVLWFDRNGATAWLLARDMATVATADTAKDFVGVAAGVNAAFISLYFSITLIVLSLAAGNLGVRLIDRWLERKLVRVSLGGLSFTLIVSLLAMMAIDAEAPLEETPLLLVAIVMALQAVNVAMLAVSLHALGRTMFVDDSIDRISRDAWSRSLSLKGVARDEVDQPHSLTAPREGYIEDVDIEELCTMFDGSARVTVHTAPGQHVMKGECLLTADCPFDDQRAKKTLPIGSYRSDNQGVVFRVRLLVEIAARALSPAINDFYTAITCADKLASIMESQAGSWVDDGHLPVYANADWLVLSGQDFRSLFSDPMSAFRQAACEYPSVTIRMIDNYTRIARRKSESGAPDALIDFLQVLARELADHAKQVAQYNGDREDIAEAYAAFEQLRMSD